jgi:RimJ/RimL family protein N-acetyltransferase
MVAIPTIETPRLKLRAYRLEDFDAYAALWADPEVVRHIGGVPFQREAAWTRFLRQIGLWHHLGFGPFGIEHRASATLVGEAGFHDLHRAIMPPLEGTMEAGWALTPALQGQGLAEEAMRAAIDWAGAHGVGSRLAAIIDPDNTPSLRLAEKLGFAEFARTTYNEHPVILLQRPRPGA